VLHTLESSPPKKNLILSAVRLCRAEFLAGLFAAGGGGGAGSSYFKRRPPTSQISNIACLDEKEPPTRRSFSFQQTCRFGKKWANTIAESDLAILTAQTFIVAPR
jgi:hypothetical protein